MSDVSVIFKVYAEEGRLGAVLEGIKRLNPHDIKTEELAFGLKAIKVMFIYDNASANSSEIEEKIRKVNGVSEIEVEQETLI